MSYGSVIAAISTPSGKGGVAIIRVSGEGSVDVCAKIFRSKSGKSLYDVKPRLQTYGDIIYNGEYVDDGMITVFPAPNSYTGEETVEISCHGGVLISRRVLEAVLASGAKHAEPGEFTRRAFINGKISLTDAEAIGNLLDAKTKEQTKLYSGASRELLSRKIDEIRHALTEILSSVFARIDYPDEDLGDFSDEETLIRLEKIKESLVSLINTYPMGRAISDGVNTVICGKPNVGKSSIYNLILGEDAAIVTDIEGTTRDILSRSVALGKIMLNLFDTAGIREKDKADTVERIGIERTHRAISDAELIIAVFDASRLLDAQDNSLIEELSRFQVPKIALVNKTDLESVIDFNRINEHFTDVISVSAKDSGIETLELLTDKLNTLFANGNIDTENTAIISSARQNAALTRTLEFVNAAIDALNYGIYTDATSSEIERALGAIAEVDGKSVCEEVVAEIFAKFCVGK